MELTKKPIQHGRMGSVALIGREYDLLTLICVDKKLLLSLKLFFKTVFHVS